MLALQQFAAPALGASVSAGGSAVMDLPSAADAGRRPPLRRPVAADADARWLAELVTGHTAEQLGVVTVGDRETAVWATAARLLTAAHGRGVSAGWREEVAALRWTLAAVWDVSWSAPQSAPEPLGW